VDETGPDQNKLQISRADMYCDNIAYIYCTYYDYCNLVSVQFSCLKKKKSVFGSISEIPVINTTW